MTNNQLQLNNDKTEMILIATKTVLNSDSVPQSINLEGSDIKFANTVRNLGVCLDPTLSFQGSVLILLSLSNSKSPPFVISAILNLVGLVQYATICLKMSPKNCSVSLFFQEQIIATHFWRAVLSIFFLNSQKYRTMLQAKTHFQNNQICPRHSYASFSSLAAYWAEDQIQIIFAFL